jgi:hypothetical protein
MFGMLFKLFGLSALGGEWKKVRAGKYGPGWQAFDAWLIGKKTFIGAILAVVTGCLMALHQPTAASMISGSIAGLFISLGLIDKAWRTVPASWEHYAFFEWMRDHAGWVTSGLGALALKFETCTPETMAALAHMHLTCSIAIIIITIASTFTAWAIGAAGVTPAPREA